MQLSNTTLSAKLQELAIDNATYDLVVSIKAALGQKFVLHDQDSNSSMASVDSSVVNIYNKQLLGVAASLDTTSAVPLSTLLSHNP